MGDEDERRPRGVAGPVVHDLQRKIATVQRRRAYLRRRLASWQGPAHERSFDTEEADALDAAEACMTYHRREVDGDAHATDLLAELVEAVRLTRAAKTEDERRFAAAAIDDAMRHAVPFVDDVE